jgi:hypothetical protein
MDTIRKKQVEIWPNIPYNDWKDTLATLQLWTQIVGKVRLRSMPWLNHSWHVTLYVTSRGLTTGSMPYKRGVFEIEFDFIQHLLSINTSTGVSEEITLYPRSVASFYQEFFSCLRKSGIDVTIHSVPNEVEPAIPFEEDETHKSYVKEQVQRFWQALVIVNKVFTRFRAGFNGKCSPVHFFWGAFDLAVTRFSGRRAPLHQGGAPNIPLRVMQEAYSHEVSSCGFWPGNETFPFPAFYAYCYPALQEFGKQPVEPGEAFYSNEMGEYLLLYDVVRTSAEPEDTLMKFLVTTYEAAANTGNWDRAALECDLSSFEA